MNDQNGTESSEPPRRLRLAMPNKGRLAGSALDLLERAGLEPASAPDRALRADLGTDFTALFVRARDIPEFVADGAADLGITGSDLVMEADRPVEALLELGFGRCRLVVAGRDEGAASVEELPDDVRIATSFPRTTERWFASRDRRVTLVPVSGAAEIAPHLGMADVIVDLVSTGSTLKVNGLREMATIASSQAVLIGRTGSPAVADPRTGQLLAALESVLRARGRRYLMANVPRSALAELRQVLPGLNGPTIVDVLNSGEHVAAHAVVDADAVYETIGRLKALGAEGILVTRIERLMP